MSIAALGLFIGAGAAGALAAEETSDLPAGLESLLETGRQLWEEYAPAEIQEEYVFPGPAEVEAFLQALEADLQEGSFQQLAAYVPEARRALGLLRLTEEGDLVADWLEPRLDFLITASEIVSADATTGPRPRARPMRPGETQIPKLPAPRPRASPNAREAWQKRIAQRPPPRNAASLVPRLKAVFREEGVPEPLVWIAEVESSMNPRARSPVGARGLFQFMPQTAKRFGMSTFMPDERTSPDKSARAAAGYLRILYRQFQSWPLSLAAYNAGEGRVGRLLKQVGGRHFADIESRLPAETRMYVPKVLATIEVREGVDPELLPGPRVASAATPAAPATIVGLTGPTL